MRPDKRVSKLLAASLGAIWLVAAPVKADNWKATIYEYGAPPHLVGVDKKNRAFNFFEKKSPFKLRYSYPCVTGQLPGDKQQINDLRTPEGVYFVEYKIANGLDFREYGGIAYTLNYPNPVDRLRGKTGHGIWIHSKGFELVPTRGCVAIDLNNIAEVGPLLLPGTPVVLAEELNGVASKDDGNLAKLRGLMGEWSKAWAARSPRMFEFYDADSYSRATENFDLFRQNKERLFKILSFIKIYNREIHAIEGPGYWVTWSEQFYTASNLSTEGIRRLYWQKNPAGEFRIVGMEWTPRDVGMRAAFQKGALVAEGPITTASDAEAPAAPRLDMPESAPAPEVSTKENKGIRGSLVALAENLLAISEPLIPRKKKNEPEPDEIIWGEGKTINEPHQKEGEAKKPAEPVDAQIVKPEPKPEEIKPVEAKPERVTPPLELPAAPKGSEKLALTAGLKEELTNLQSNWLNAWREKSAKIDSFYDAKNFNKLPASAGAPRGSSLNTALQQIKREYRQPWLEIISRKPVIEVKNQVASTRADLMIITPQGMRQGVQTLWWRKDPAKAGEFRIVASSFKQEALGMEANYLERVSGQIADMVEKWRKAWEGASLDDYMSFYANNASQQGRGGASNIRHQKQGLWSRVKPAYVRLSGLRVSLDGTGARADMTQAYSDTAGRSDKGVKTLHLRYDGKNWLIQREDWADLPKNTGD